MTIHWKALEEHFLMIPFDSTDFWGKMNFLSLSLNSYDHDELEKGICSIVYPGKYL
jgi:hypothetical protein